MRSDIKKLIRNVVLTIICFAYCWWFYVALVRDDNLQFSVFNFIQLFMVGPLVMMGFCMFAAKVLAAVHCGITDGKWDSLAGMK